MNHADCEKMKNENRVADNIDEKELFVLNENVKISPDSRTF